MSLRQSAVSFRRDGPEAGGDDRDDDQDEPERPEDREEDPAHQQHDDEQHDGTDEDLGRKRWACWCGLLRRHVAIVRPHEGQGRSVRLGEGVDSTALVVAAQLHERSGDVAECIGLAVFVHRLLDHIPNDHLGAAAQAGNEFAQPVVEQSGISGHTEPRVVKAAC